LFLATKIQAHLAPFSKGQMANPSPLGALLKKLQFQGKLFTSIFLQAAVAGPILGIDFLRKFKVIVSPELSQIQFACSAATPSAHILPSAAPSAHITPPAAPPASYCSSSFSFRENKSLLDPPPLFKKIPDSVPDDVKILLQKFPSILRTGDVKPTPNYGVEHHIHTGSHPPFLQNPAASIQKNCKSPRRNSYGWNPLALFTDQHHHGFSFAHGTQKRWIVAALWRLPLFKSGDNPRQVSFAKHARPFQWSTRLHNFFQN
jgi:hypothetical protein